MINHQRSKRISNLPRLQGLLRFQNFRLFAGICVVLFCAIHVPTAEAQSEAEFAKRRKVMVEYAVRRAGVKDSRVLKAMNDTPRHQFVPKAIRNSRSYLDAGVPIGEAQTISSPFIVAYMTQELEPQPTDKVLEIGTGSGYQAAVLSPLVKEVYSIEIVESLGKTAAKVLKKLKYKNVFTKIGDGYLGWEGACAVRQNHRDVLARKYSSAVSRPIKGRRHDRGADGRTASANAVFDGKAKRKNGPQSVAANAVRTDDGRSRGPTASETRPREPDFNQW